MRVIDKPFPNSDDSVALSKITIEYIQDLDCCQSKTDYSEDYQCLTVTTDDGGGGKFLRIHTGNSGWSISDIDELITLLTDFKDRLKC